jgi:microsomal dipeptidase-like Zn-dependent dipeptidase
MLKKCQIIGCLVILLQPHAFPRHDSSGSCSTEELAVKARKIHAQTLTLDAHVDIEVSFITPEIYGGKHHEKLVTFPGMEKGGMDAIFFAVYTAQGPRTPNDYDRMFRQATEKFRRIHTVIAEEYAEKMGIALEPNEVWRLQEAGKKIGLIGMENGYPLGEDLVNIKHFYDLGCRYITLCHNGHNQLCDSHQNSDGPVREHNGISPFGEQVIAEMNRLGIIVDISHLSKKSMLDVARLSQAPVIASHSCCRTLCDVSRNLDDAQLLALKANGGVIHIVAISDFVKSDPPEKKRALEILRAEMGFPQDEMKFLEVYVNSPEAKKAAYQERAAAINKKYPGATIEDYVDHIDHAVKLIGIDHVGISSDFYESPYCIEGWEDVGKTFNITMELVKRGYGEAEISKIWSGNLLRVWSEVEKTAVEMKK